MEHLVPAEQPSKKKDNQTSQRGISSSGFDGGLDQYLCNTTTGTPPRKPTTRTSVKENHKPTSTPKAKRKSTATGDDTTTKKVKRTSSGYAPPSKYAHLVNHLTDSLAPNLICIFVGLNPGIRTATTGHAYNHPSNLFWKLLHKSACTPRLCQAEEDGKMPQLYQLGLTNIVSRPTKDGSELSKAEMDEGVAVLEAKIALQRPEAVAIVGKSIWESIWRVRHRTNIKKDQFRYGWQDDTERMGVIVEGDEQWPGARLFVTTTTSGLAAGMRPHEKEEIWKGLGDWVARRRAERSLAINQQEKDFWLYYSQDYSLLSRSKPFQILSFLLCSPLHQHIFTQCQLPADHSAASFTTRGSVATSSGSTAQAATWPTEATSMCNHTAPFQADHGYMASESSTAQQIVANLDRSANDPLSVRSQIDRDVFAAENPSRVESDPTEYMTPSELMRMTRLSHFKSRSDLEERERHRGEGRSQGQTQQQEDVMSQQLTSMTLNAGSDIPRQQQANGASQNVSRPQRYRAGQARGSQHEHLGQHHSRASSHPAHHDRQGLPLFPPHQLLPLLIPQLAHLHALSSPWSHGSPAPPGRGLPMAHGRSQSSQPILSIQRHNAANSRGRGRRGQGQPHPLSLASSYPNNGANPQQQGPSQDGAQQHPQSGQQQHGSSLGDTQQPPPGNQRGTDEGRQ
ncbi:MAG: hypothetical protein Q9218_003133 [Villophora microphyllina]